MVTNPELEPTPPTTEERAVTALRVAVAGHEQGSVRRILLYAAAFALIVSPVPGLAVLPLILLALTDVLA